MTDQIDLHEPRHSTVPVGPGPDRDLGLQQTHQAWHVSARTIILARSPAILRSMVAALIETSKAASALDRSSSPSRRRIGTRTDRCAFAHRQTHQHGVTDDDEGLLIDTPPRGGFR